MILLQITDKVTLYGEVQDAEGGALWTKGTGSQGRTVPERTWAYADL